MTDKMIPVPMELMYDVLGILREVAQAEVRLTDAQERAVDCIAPSDRRVCVYDLTPASDVESTIHSKLIELGWKPPSPADEELRRERVRKTLDDAGFRLQDDYYLANGASLMSEDSHQIIHRDVVDEIVCAAIAAEKREEE